MVYERAALVDVPRYKTQEIRPLAPEQARSLLCSVTSHRLWAIVSVATALGLRSFGATYPPSVTFRTARHALDTEIIRAHAAKAGEEV